MRGREEVGLSVSPSYVGKVGDFGALYVSGGVGIVTIDRIIRQTAHPWATILQAGLPGGIRPAAIARAPVSIDDRPGFAVLCVVSATGSVSVMNRSADTADFGAECNAYGEAVFPIA